MSKAVMRAPVSVIIPCYRCAGTIGRAVNSVMLQKLLPEEVILIEDGSNDSGKTLAAMIQIKAAYGELPFRILCFDKNTGPASARNAGWGASTQPYLAFLDADDVWHPDKLDAQYGWMASHPDVVLSGHLSQKMPLSGVMPTLPKSSGVCRVKGRSLVFTNYFFTRSVMIKREIPYRFPAAKRYAEDYWLWLTLIYSGYEAWVMNTPLAYSFKEEFGEGGLTGNLWKTQQGVLDVYRRLRQTGHISNILFIVVSAYSLLKFVRRWILTKIRFKSSHPV